MNYDLRRRGLGLTASVGLIGSLVAAGCGQQTASTSEKTPATARADSRAALNVSTTTLSMYEGMT